MLAWRTSGAARTSSLITDEEVSLSVFAGAIGRLLSCGALLLGRVLMVISLSTCFSVSPDVFGGHRDFIREAEVRLADFSPSMLEPAAPSSRPDYMDVSRNKG